MLIQNISIISKHYPVGSRFEWKLRMVLAIQYQSIDDHHPVLGNGKLMKTAYFWTCVQPIIGTQTEKLPARSDVVAILAMYVAFSVVFHVAFRCFQHLSASWDGRNFIGFGFFVIGLQLEGATDRTQAKENHDFLLRQGS